MPAPPTKATVPSTIEQLAVGAVVERGRASTTADADSDSMRHPAFRRRRTGRPHRLKLPIASTTMRDVDAGRARSESASMN